jgi:hypothetical protein
VDLKIFQRYTYGKMSYFENWMTNLVDLKLNGQKSQVRQNLETETSFKQKKNDRKMMEKKLQTLLH